MTDAGKTTLTTRIMAAMIAGALLGVFLNLQGLESPFVQEFLVEGVFSVVGAVFISALKMLVVPLVFVSLVCGVTSLGDMGMLGRIGCKALVLYLLTTAAAITIALFLAVSVAPGGDFIISGRGESFTLSPPPPLSQVLTDLVPSNPIAALADGNMLQIIVFAILFGISMTLARKQSGRIIDFFGDLNGIIMKMVGLIMHLAPYGVFCLIARTFTLQGADVIAPLTGYFLVVICALLLHAGGSFSLLLRLVGGLDPLIFFRKMRAAMVFAFSTASSNATIPATLSAVENKLGVKNSVAAFTVPLGATINMDGTAIMQGVATVFIANVYGIGLGMGDLVTIVLTATLASIGTAGVPGVGLIMLTMVLTQVGLPVEGIALIIGVDRLLDMVRTAVNITGDATVSCLVAKSENALDQEMFNDPAAGVVRD
uniref:Putative Sodium:dicarboxylate symporter family protein n=1 Tax=uncultured marine microorganism HF4000_APKG8K5 TaxID=455555 RepID=B3TB33_9ZZZZ|nr:putative Sodium:dicarboxylate symporter family protein [uncultured marine microorganism HF4000_APKG8K5]